MTLIPQIKPCLLSINLSIIYPVSIGEKKYPNKLKINWLILDEVAWQSFCTEDIIIPVAIGIIAAPKNKKVHNSTHKYTNLNKNPIGKAKTKETNPKRIHIFIASRTLSPLYPPYLSEKVPPTKIPNKGAVTLIKEKTKYINKT